MGAVALQAPPGLPTSGASGLLCGFHAHPPNPKDQSVKAAWKQKRPEGLGGGRPDTVFFCWRAYTLALTRRAHDVRGSAGLPWHVFKTAQPDAALGVSPGVVARPDGAEGHRRGGGDARARGFPAFGEPVQARAALGLWVCWRDRPHCGCGMPQGSPNRGWWLFLLKWYTLVQCYPCVFVYQRSG
jgi:hypothetical protein